MKSGNFIKLALFSLCVLVAGTLGMPRASIAANTTTSCMDAAAGFTTQCTSKDVLFVTVEASNVSGGELADGVCVPGSDLTADFLVVVQGNSPDRYDLGLFFNADGTNAQTGGTCNRVYWASSDSGIGDLSGSDASNYAGFTDIDGDACGDIHNSEYVGKTVSSVLFKCSDSDGDGYADLSYCGSWKEPGANNTICNNVLGAVPGTAAKCSCDVSKTDIIVPEPKISVTKTPPSQVISPGGNASFTITVTNTGNVPLDNVTIDDTTTCNNSCTPSGPTQPTTLDVGAHADWTCTINNITSSCSNSVTASGTYNFPEDLADPINVNAGPAVANVVVDPRGAGLAVPTMTQWGMILFVFLAGIASIYYLRKRKKNI